jgi:hypothetical protein
MTRSYANSVSFASTDERGAPLTRPYAPGEHLLDVVPPAVARPERREVINDSTRRENTSRVSKPHVAGEPHFEDHVNDHQATSGHLQSPRLDVRQSLPEPQQQSYASPPMYPTQPNPGVPLPSRGIPDASVYTPPPRLSVSRFPSELSPGDSRSENSSYVERPRSGSSATSTALFSPAKSTAGSGTLGPRVYQYEPLKEMEFRLVKILPEKMSKLKCEILHQSLNDAPEYIAISVSTLQSPVQYDVR